MYTYMYALRSIARGYIHFQCFSLMLYHIGIMQLVSAVTAEDLHIHVLSLFYIGTLHLVCAGDVCAL